MTYDLFNQLLYIRSTHNNEADFLNELKNMTKEDVSRHYENSQKNTQQVTR